MDTGHFPLKSPTHSDTPPFRRVSRRLGHVTGSPLLENAGRLGHPLRHRLPGFRHGVHPEAWRLIGIECSPPPKKKPTWVRTVKCVSKSAYSSTGLSRWRHALDLVFRNRSRFLLRSYSAYSFTIGRRVGKARGIWKLPRGSNILSALMIGQTQSDVGLARDMEKFHEYRPNDTADPRCI